LLIPDAWISDNAMKDARLFRGVAVRTDEALELRLDRLAMLLSTPGGRVKRAQAAREAMLRGLDALEREIVPAIVV
jgi:hypothetical protein